MTPEAVLRARPGEVEVRLPETPTSGYLWHLVGPPDGVRVVARDLEPSPAALGAAGAGGCRVFRLAVDAPGEYTLTFELRRPWEHTPRERARLLVIITP
ncbi:protease inhibitor I42 family protein [Sorangium sp. So ce131]|uniref:protease inhibitor I42 family protein n=1 Tax=Sorangium sp. So ce131 TaxID=3133282 RepID=UPI003F5DD23B